MHATTRRLRRPGRVLGVAALAAVTTLGGSGCAVPFLPNACPAVGYLKHVDIVLSGPNAAAADLVVLCDDLGCSMPAADAVTPQTAGPFWYATETSAGHWRIDLDLSEPERVAVEVLDADRATLATADVELEWHRTGGSERCGGPAEADPILIDVD